MPYFRKENILFIHIPKTGGTSLERYFSQKFNVKLDASSLCYEKFKNNITLQHQTLSNIIINNHIFKIPFNNPNLKIITIVRNPYHRIMSELFYLGYIDNNSTQEKVYKVLSLYLSNNNTYDNHKLPQYKFLVNDDGFSINNNIIILKTENLNEMMKEIGFNDFNCHENTNKCNIKNDKYMSMLNNDSLRLINKYYSKDFLYFGYRIIPMSMK